MADYISREAVLALGYWHGEHPDFDNPCPDGIDAVDTSDIETIPAADVVEVVRCKDCEFSRRLTKNELRIWLNECRACENPEASQSGYMIVFPEHFCSYGRRASNADMG